MALCETTKKMIGRYCLGIMRSDRVLRIVCGRGDIPRGGRRDGSVCHISPLRKSSQWTDVIGFCIRIIVSGKISKLWTIHRKREYSPNTLHSGPWFQDQQESFRLQHVIVLHCLVRNYEQDGRALLLSRWMNAADVGRGTVTFVGRGGKAW